MGARRSAWTRCRKLLDDALPILERTGERWFAAELNRHKDRMPLRQGYSEAAEELYRKALSIAEEQGPSSGNCDKYRAVEQPDEESTC
jgi:predicted negative regulator of RcsB-dependent stress response